MSVLIAHASHDERGRVSGGNPGDQTGQEVTIRTWYYRPWSHVIRFKDPIQANKVAEAMKKAAANNKIGYNQRLRNTALSKCRKYGYDPSKIRDNCDTDCSAIVSLACMYAGVPENVLFKDGNSSTTSNLRPRLKTTGLVDILTDKKYTKEYKNLQVGDILLYETHHVAVVVSTGSEEAVKTKLDNIFSVEDIARQVISGKWGKGLERERNITAAGYDYKVVQAKVNELLGR